MQQVRYGRRQSVQMDAPTPAPEVEVSTSFTQGVDASKELVDDAKPISKSFTQGSTLENRITFKDDNNDGTVETKKRFAGVSRRKSMTYEREEFEKRSAEEERKERNRRKIEETELVDDILEIPELGDDGEGDITTQVAAPPKEFRQHRMQTISQLEKDVQYHLPADSTIDLSMLTMALSPADKVEEEDVLWTGESLLQELASSMDALESM